MTYNKPEQFTDKQVSIFHNMNIILDDLSKRIESLNGVARFLHTRLNEQEGRIDMLEKVNMKLVEGFGKASSDKTHKRVGTLLNEEDAPNNPLGSENGEMTDLLNSLEKVQGDFHTETPSEKPKRKYIKKFPNKKLGRPKKKSFPKKKLGRPRKKSSIQQYKEVYNPDIDETKSGIE